MSLKHYKVDVTTKRKRMHRTRIVSAYNEQDAVIIFCQRYGHAGPGAFAHVSVTPINAQEKQHHGH